MGLSTALHCTPSPPPSTPHPRCPITPTCTRKSRRDRGEVGEGESNFESLNQERSQHWDRQWYNIWMPRPGTHCCASPIKLSSPQWRGLENWHLHWECVSSFAGTDNFHLCRNRFAPKGSNNSRAIPLMLVFGRKIGMRAGDLEGLLTGTKGILVWKW